MQGYDVCLYGRNEDVVRKLSLSACIHLCGRIQGVGRLNSITTDIHKAVQGATIIMVVTTANSHAEIATKIAGDLKDEQIVILNPGRTGGALEFRNALNAAGNKAHVYVSEAQTLIYACRLVEVGTVNIIGIKEKVLISSVPANDIQFVLNNITPAFPCFCAAENVLRTSLENVGAILHPCVLLFNAATIERNSEFWFYRDTTPQIASFIERFDMERLAVGKAYGVDLLSVNEWINYAYPGTKGGTLCERMRNNPAYHDIKSPSTIFTRQLTEDIPTGVLPIIELGRVAGVPTPLMHSMVNICGALLGINFYTTGRTLKKLGLSGMSQNDIIKYLS